MRIFRCCTFGNRQPSLFKYEQTYVTITSLFIHQFPLSLVTQSVICNKQRIKQNRNILSLLLLPAHSFLNETKIIKVPILFAEEDYQTMLKLVGITRIYKKFTMRYELRTVSIHLSLS